MEWLEIINIRSSNLGNQVNDLCDFKEGLHRFGKKTGLKEVRFYRHASLKSDVSIHLFFESNEKQADKSELGIRLIASLKELGLVNHSLWVLEDPKKLNRIRKGRISC